MRIGEVVAGSVLDGLTVKLTLENAEDLRIGYPVIVEGHQYDFYCIVHDILNERTDIAERLAGSDWKEEIALTAGKHEGFSGPLFYSKAHLRPIQLIAKETAKLSEPQTIPPYFAEARHASRADVELIYQPTETSAPLGTITGIEPYYVDLDFAKLTEKPFAIFGRTGMGKSILNKLVCCGILAKEVANVLIFDMHGEYGVWSRTDKTEGLKYYFPEKVQLFSLDAKNREARPFVLDPREITPADLIIAFQDLSPRMVDALFEIDKRRGDRDLLTAIRQATVADLGEETVHEMSVNALKGRLGRIERLPFVVAGAKDSFGQMVGLIRDGKSIVLDFGDFGTDQAVYLIVANILSRRLFEMYTENEDLPRLVLFLEEAHKFLSPEVSNYTIFSRLARETRKFDLLLALVDQRPMRIDDEVRSQLANRLILSLKEPNDVTAALAGVPDSNTWEKVVATIPHRTVLAVGDAIRVPTVIDVMKYDELNVSERITGGRATTAQMADVLKRVDDVFAEKRKMRPDENLDAKGKGK